MNRIKRKLRSRSGASITFALLLFLVCAVLSSVIIAAASASAGRMAGIAEMDQRYCCVTSASELLKDMLNNKTVAVVKETKSWSTTTYTDGVAGTPAPNHDETGEKLPEVKNYLVTGQNAAQILGVLSTTDSIPSGWTEITDSSTIQKASIQNDAAYLYFSSTTIPATLDGAPRTLTLESSPDLKTALGLESGDSDPLAVTITETLDSTGKITLTVNNTNGGGSFRQQLVFSAYVVRKDDTKSVDGAPNNYTLTAEGKSSYTVTTTTAKYEITALTWTLDSIKTLSAA